MGSVNLDGLTRAEQDEYARLGDLSTYPSRERRAVYRPVLPLLGAWTAASTFFLVIGGIEASQGQDSSLVAVGLGILFAGVVTIPFHARRVALRGVKARQESYLAEARSRPRQPVDSRDDFRHVSERQRQREWYGEHSDLNWRDRQTAETLGMDADSYKSNFLND